MKMEYTVTDLIGMLNLGLIIAYGTNEDKFNIPVDAAKELIVYLENLKLLTST